LTDVVCIFSVSSHFQENHEGNKLAYENAKVHSKKAAVQVPEVSTSSGKSPGLKFSKRKSCGLQKNDDMSTKTLIAAACYPDPGKRNTGEPKKHLRSKLVF
jgi:hypothetical protein